MLAKQHCAPDCLDPTTTTDTPPSPLPGATSVADPLKLSRIANPQELLYTLLAVSHAPQPDLLLSGEHSILGCWLHGQDRGRVRAAAVRPAAREWPAGWPAVFGAGGAAPNSCPRRIAASSPIHVRVPFCAGVDALVQDGDNHAPNPPTHPHRHPTPLQ